MGALGSDPRTAASRLAKEGGYARGRPRSAAARAFSVRSVQRNYLFNSGLLRDALDEHKRKVIAEVEAAPADHVLHVDEDEWVDALVDRWRVNVPELLPDEAWMDPPKEVPVDVSHEHFTRAIMDPSTPTYIPGYRVVIHIPFVGDAAVFGLRANTYTLSGPPSASVRGSELVDVIEYPHDSPRDIDGHLQSIVSKVNQQLAWVGNDVEVFHQELPGVARSAISNRRARVKNHAEHIARSSLPVGRPSSDDRTYITEAIVRRPAPVLPRTPDHEPMVLEPVLADEIYEHILGIIRSLGRDWERSPNTYVAMGEEDRRQAILSTLNTHYRGQGTAEGFNFNGKTDLLIRHEGQNLFIGECKIWDGEKKFLDTIDQIFRYRAWRDTKLAVIMFVGEEGLTAIVERARAALGQHNHFVSWGDAAEDAELRCAVKWPGDDRRLATMHVFFVHLPD